MLSQQVKRFSRLYAAGIGGASYLLLLFLYIKSIREITRCTQGFCNTVSEPFEITISFDGGIYTFPLLIIAGIVVVVGTCLNVRNAFLQRDSE